ncbi:Os10g0422401, partial [Oryza sativa Japonica Group]
SVESSGRATVLSSKFQLNFHPIIVRFLPRCLT